MLDVLSEVIDDTGLDGEPTQLLLQTRCVVAGALLRTARKTCGGQVCEFTAEFLVRAMCGEFARVTSDFPRQGRILEPQAFLATAMWIGRQLAARGQIETPEPLPRGLLPTLIDVYPAYAVVDDTHARYASAELLRMLGIGWRSFMAWSPVALIRQRGLHALAMGSPFVNDEGQRIGDLIVVSREPLLDRLDLPRFTGSLRAWDGLLAQARL